MPSIILKEFFVSALKNAYEGDSQLESTYRKVEAILRNYAELKKVAYKKLRVIDIITDSGELQPQLLSFIHSLPRLPKQTEQRRKRYISENASRIRRLMSAVTDVKFKGSGVRTKPVSILMAQVPDYLKSVIGELPKSRASARGGAGKNLNPIGALVRNGQLLLLALCQVSNKYGVDNGVEPLENLLLNHHDDVLVELRSLATSAYEFQTLKTSHYRLLKKLNLKRERSIERLRMDQWPQPFRGEFERFLMLASGQAIPDKAVLDSALRHGYPLDEYSPKTITLITNTMSQVMSSIPHKGKLSILDLIKLRKIKIRRPEGVTVERRNSKVDHIREREQAKSTKRKRVGYDSSLFRNFLHAIRAIASRNGYGHLIEPFNQVYKVRTDKKGKRSRKAEKKSGISRYWISKELERVGAEFDRIVKGQLFKRGSGIGNMDADRCMRLCLFYVQLLVMRLIGYRQQAIRDCVLNENIRFLPDGTLILHFGREKVKNKHILHFEISPSERGTHERLRKVLILY